MSGISFNGLVSGLDTDAIISQLVRFNELRINAIQQRSTGVQIELELFEQIEGKVQAFQNDSIALAKSVDSVFDRKSASSSDESIVKVAAGSAAEAGIHAIKITDLARANQLATAGFDSPATLINTGTVQISAGGSSATITIDSTNNTFEGLAQEINGANVGVTAAIINDGTATNPYRLLLTSEKTGASSAISFTNNLNTGGAVRPNLSGIGDVNGTFSGSSSATSNSGAATSTYTGPDNDTYTFEVKNGGTEVDYNDGSGHNSGTLSFAGAGTHTVAEGLEVTFTAGTLVDGDQFTVDVFVPTVQAATNSKVQLGSGGGAIIVENQGNLVQNLFEGVTLDIQAADATKEVTLTIADDTAGANTAIQSFVANFNDLMTFIEEQMAFDASSQTGGPLIGNSSLISIQNSIRSVVLSVSSELPVEINRLSAIGIKFNSQGLLDLDQGKLNQYLNGDIPGVEFGDLKRLFGLTGASTNNGIQFTAGSDRTKESTSPIEIDIERAAEQATLTAANSLTGSSIAITGANNELVLTLNGKQSGTIALDVGSYTHSQLAAELEAKINADATLSGRKVDVSLNADKLVINSRLYGIISEVTIDSGSSLGTIGYTPAQTDRGENVKGSFIVDGVTETATGSGQSLVGAIGNATTADLRVLVSLTPSQVVAGVDGELTVSRGVASKIQLQLTSLLDPVSGRFDSITDSLQDQIDSLQEDVSDELEALDDRTSSLLRQFAALEQSLGTFQSTSNLLSSRLGTLLTNQTATQ